MSVPSTRAWRTTTLPPEPGLPLGASEDDAYRALDWLVTRKERIEAKLARRHVRSGSLVRFDLSSTCVEGEHRELAAFGCDRHEKRGKDFRRTLRPTLRRTNRRTKR